MSLTQIAEWLLTGHRHKPGDTVLAPLVAAGAVRSQLVEVYQCTDHSCPAVCPVAGPPTWIKPARDEEDL